MGISESLGEGHERFIHICPKPFISTKDRSPVCDEDLGLGRAGVRREGGGLELSFRPGTPGDPSGVMVTP